MTEVTRLLETTGPVSEKLLPLVYDELRKLAASRMSAERSDHTLQPTALVHEAYLRLVGDREQPWVNRAHFFAAAADAMRLIVIALACAIANAPAVHASQPKPVSPTTKPGEVYSGWPFDAKEAAKRQNDTAKNLGIAKNLTLGLGNNLTMKLLLIPAGKYMMGIPGEELLRVPIESEKAHSPSKLDASGEAPQHEVTLTRPFFMGIYPVTQIQYQQVSGASPSQFKGATNPVEKIAWADAVDFCKKLSQKTGRKVRLPTEAEWEYACRAGTATAFNTGLTISADQANYWATFTWGDGKKGLYRGKTTPVGSFKPNAWGLYDMHGNVLQWCSDWYRKTYYAKSPAADPPGPETGVRRVLRGGGFGYMPAMCRSAYRENHMPEWRYANMGFRVVVDLE